MSDLRKGLEELKMSANMRKRIIEIVGNLKKKDISLSLDNLIASMKGEFECTNSDVDDVLQELQDERVMVLMYVSVRKAEYILPWTIERYEISMLKQLVFELMERIETHEAEE